MLSHVTAHATSALNLNLTAVVQFCTFHDCLFYAGLFMMSRVFNLPGILYFVVHTRLLQARPFDSGVLSSASHLGLHPSFELLALALRSSLYLQAVPG